MFKIINRNNNYIYEIFCLDKENVKFVKYGNEHVIIVTKNNKIFVMGNNSFGQLGTEDVFYKYNFVKLENILFKNITHLECGTRFTIIVNNFNEIYFTGIINDLQNSLQNYFTKIHELNIVKFIRCSFKELFIVTTDNTVYSSNSKNITKIMENKNIKDLQCGEYHSIILDNFGIIYTRGKNFYGQLGTEILESSLEFTKVHFPHKIIKIACGMDSTFILTKKNELFSCGNNNCGYLGLGDCKNRYTFTKIVMNERVKDIYSSKTEYMIISNINNEFFVSGSNEDKIFGMLDCCKELYKDCFKKLL